jgi:hypothetical protein
MTTDDDINPTYRVITAELRHYRNGMTQKQYRGKYLDKLSRGEAVELCIRLESEGTLVDLVCEQTEITEYTSPFPDYNKQRDYVNNSGLRQTHS